MFSQANKKTLQYSTGENFEIKNAIAFWRPYTPPRIGSLRVFAPQRDKLNQAIFSTLPAKNGVQPVGIDPNVAAAFGKIFTNSGRVIKEKPKKF